MPDNKYQLDEILEGVYLYGMNGGLGYGKFQEELSPGDAKQTIQAIIATEVAEAVRYAKLDVILESNDLLRSASAIAFRHGKKTNWKQFESKVNTELDKQHKLMYPEKYVALQPSQLEKEGK